MKTIDATLLDDKARSATTLTDLLLVGPLDDGSYRGMTLLDRDVTYEPSVLLGEITFKARTGFEMSALESTNDMGVNNAEAMSLPPIVGFELEGFTQAEIDSGALDKVKFVVLRVNYMDLTAGSEVIAGGTIGEVKRKVGGLTVLELRSLSQQLRQKSIVQLDSTTCRARFGSGGSSNAPQELFPCGFDAESLWVAGSITSVGGETDRIFMDTSLIGAGVDRFAPGMVDILSGDNEGQMIEVESFDSATGIVELTFPTVSPLVTGVTYQIREQCTKRWTGHNSCDTFWGSSKPLHFRGEPHIPVGQTNTLNIPGASVPSGVDGGGQVA